MNPIEISPSPRGHGKRVLGTMVIMLGTGIALETTLDGWGIAIIIAGAFLALVGALQGWKRKER
jgi:hypothetical protein